MTIKRAALTLPSAPEDYDAQDQRETRRLTEQAILQVGTMAGYAASVADSKAVSAVAGGGADSIARSKGDSAGTLAVTDSASASTADSKAVSVSVNTSSAQSTATAESKGVSAGTQASTADSKALSVSVLTSTADSKAVSVGTANLSGTAATSATTGTMTVNMTTAQVTITPTGACTFNAGAGGTAGQRVHFVISTSGASSFVLTFGTNYRPNGTLATGTVTAKIFSLLFVSNGTSWIEQSRTTAL